MKKQFWVLLCAIFLVNTATIKAQELTHPKREFRGVWIATVVNIDWPSKPSLDVEQQKNELLNILDQHQKQGLNAIMLQVRPAADAFYAKSTEPWSQWLTGAQGQKPDPLYDPLEFAIQECHKRGMELHAWFNPYRATFSSNAVLHETHIVKKRPDWFIEYGGKKLFDPGLPEVREYITQIILNVVKNYNIDGVHFDDYFYPYGVKGEIINDGQTFKNHSNGFSNVADWRRNNVDLLIKKVADSIKFHKNHVKFGISPFGIWQNKRQSPEGSETNGGDSYHGLFADSRKWAKEGWIDYINPQIYWSFSSVPAPYAKLVDWWSYNAYGRHLYIGHGAYRINDPKDAAWRNPKQIADQIVYNRNNPRVQGSVYFSSKSLTSNRLGISDTLSNNYYKHPALPPVMLWLDSVPPNRPENLLAIQIEQSVVLSWKQPATAKDGDIAFGYVVYRFNDDEPADLDSVQAIKNIYYNDITSWEDKTVEPGKSYKYLVTAIDRLKNESEHSIPVTIKVTEKRSERK